MEADQVSPQCQCDQTSKTMSTAREIYDYLLALLFHNPPPPPPLLHVLCWHLLTRAGGGKGVISGTFQ